MKTQQTQRKLFREPSQAKQDRESENRRLRTETFGKPATPAQALGLKITDNQIEAAREALAQWNLAQ